MQSGKFHVYPCFAPTDGHLMLSKGKMNMTHTAILCPQGKYECNSDNNTVRVSTEDFFILSGPHLPRLLANLHLLYVTATFMWFMWSVNASGCFVCEISSSEASKCSVLYSGRTRWNDPHMTVRPHLISRLKPLEPHWRAEVALWVFFPLF